MKKPFTPLKKKHLRRVRSFIRRAEKRGYVFDTSLKESLSSLSTQKLKSLTPKKLYSEATATSITGKQITGLQKRGEERQASAKKGAETRKFNLWLQTPEGQEYQRQQEEEARLKEDKERKEQEEKERARASEFREGEIIYEQILAMMKAHPSAGCVHLEYLFFSEIKTFGRENVLRALAQAPEKAIEQAQIAIYYPEQTTATELHRALIALDSLIRGYIRTEEDARDLGDVLDFE